MEIAASAGTANQQPVHKLRRRQQRGKHDRVGNRHDDSNRGLDCSHRRRNPALVREQTYANLALGRMLETQVPRQRREEQLRSNTLGNNPE